MPPSRLPIWIACLLQTAKRARQPFGFKEFIGRHALHGTEVSAQTSRLQQVDLEQIRDDPTQ